MLLFTKTINDSVRGDAEQPRRHLLDRPRLNQRVEHILQNVLGIGRVRHALADEVAESSALPVERLFNAQYSVHLPSESGRPARTRRASRWARSRSARASRPTTAGE